MKKKKKILIFLLGILFTFLIFMIIFYAHKPDLELVYTKERAPIRGNSPYWICIKDEKYNGFFTKEFLDQYNVDYENWDLKNHTYIASFGYKITDIEYSYYRYRHNHGDIRPLGFMPKITVEGSRDDKVYIYELDKINLESYFPDGPDEIVFK